MSSKLLSPAPSLARTSRSSLQCLRPSPYLQRRYISAYGYEQARALVFATYGEPHNVLSLHSHSISPPHGDLMTLRFLASPINPADINQIQGVYPSKPTFTTSLGTANPIAVAGNEGVAEVIALGDRAKQEGFRKGDWVIMQAPGFGTWRTHASATPQQVVKLEEETCEGITAIQAGTVSINPCTRKQDILHLSNPKLTSSQKQTPLSLPDIPPTHPLPSPPALPPWSPTPT